MSANRKIGAEVFVTAENAKTELDSFTKKVENVGTTVEKSNKAATVAANGLASSSNAQAAAVGAAGQAVKAATAAVAGYNKELTAARSDLALLNQQIVEAAKAGDSNAEVVNKLKSEYADLSAQIRVLSAERAEEIENLKAISGEYKIAKQELAAFENSQDQAETSWSDLASTIAEAASEMQAAGLAISAGVTAPLVAVGVVVAKTGAEFESSLNVIAAQSAEASARINEFRTKAVQLGADLTLPKTSANNAAEAMLALSKAGLSVNDTLDASKATLLLAAAATTDEAKAAEIAATSLQQFNLAGSQTAIVVDLLAASASASSLEITDVAESLKYVGPIAKDLKISINETVTAITMLAQAGIKGEMSGTALRGILTDLNPTSKEAKAAMTALGVSVFDANHKMLPLPQVIDRMHSALSKLTEQSRQQALATIFGKEQMVAASIIFGQGAEAFAKLEAEVSRAGVAQEQAGAKAKGLSGAVEGLQSQVETVTLAFSALTNGPLESTTRSVTEMVPKVALAAVTFAQANPEIVAFGIALVGVTAVAGPVLLALGSIIAFVGGPFTIALIAAIGTVSAVIYAYINDTGALRTHTIGVTNELSATWKTLGLTTSDAFLAMKIAIEAFVNVVVGPITALIGLVRFLADQTKKAAVLIVAGFKAAQGDIAGAMQTITETVYSGAKNTVKASNDGISGLSDGWGYRLNEVRTMLVQANGQYSTLGFQAGNNYVNGVKRALTTLPGLGPKTPGFGQPGGFGGFGVTGGSSITNRMSQFTQEQIKDQQAIANEAAKAGTALNTAFGDGGSKQNKGAAATRAYANELVNLRKRAEEAEASLLGDSFARREAKIDADIKAERAHLQINKRDKQAALNELTRIQIAQAQKVRNDEREAEERFNREILNLRLTLVLDDRTRKELELREDIKQKEKALIQEYGLSQDTQIKIDEYARLKTLIFNDWWSKETRAASVRQRQIRIDEEKKFYDEARELAISLGRDTRREQQSLAEGVGRKLGFDIGGATVTPEQRRQVEDVVKQMNELHITLQLIDGDYDRNTKASRQFLSSLRVLQAFSRGDVMGGLRASLRSVRDELFNVQTATDILQNAFDSAFSSIGQSGTSFLRVLGASLISGMTQIVAGVLSQYGTMLISKGLADIAMGIANSANPLAPGSGAAQIAAGQHEVLVGSAMKVLSGIASGLGSAAASAVQGGGSRAAANGAGVDGSTTSSGSTGGAGRGSDRPSPATTQLPVPSGGGIRGGGETHVHLNGKETKDFLKSIIIDGYGVLTTENISRKNSSQFKSAVKAVVRVPEK